MYWFFNFQNFFQKKVKKNFQGKLLAQNCGALGARVNCFLDHTHKALSPLIAFRSFSFFSPLDLSSSFSLSLYIFLSLSSFFFFSIAFFSPSFPLFLLLSFSISFFSFFFCYLFFCFCSFHFFTPRFSRAYFRRELGEKREQCSVFFLKFFIFYFYDLNQTALKSRDISGSFKPYLNISATKSDEGGEVEKKK